MVEMMDGNQKGLAPIVFVVVAAAVVVIIAVIVGLIGGKLTPQPGSQKVATGAATTSAKTNPFDTYKNPFEKYNNPFSQFVK